MNILTAAFEGGGVLMYALLAVSLGIWLLILYRWQRLRAEPCNGYDFTCELQSALLRHDVAACHRVINQQPGMLAAVTRELFGPDMRLPSREQLIAGVVAARQRLLRPDDVIRTLIRVAPLLGLLGTVLGMMETFATLQLMGTAAPESLSVGISQALITTQTGLTIAVAGIFGHAWVRKREKQLEVDFDRVELVLAQMLEDAI